MRRVQGAARSCSHKSFDGAAQRSAGRGRRVQRCARPPASAGFNKPAAPLPVPVQHTGGENGVHAPRCAQPEARCAPPRLLPHVAASSRWFGARARAPLPLVALAVGAAAAQGELSQGSRQAVGKQLKTFESNRFDSLQRPALARLLARLLCLACAFSLPPPSGLQAAGGACALTGMSRHDRHFPL